MWIPRLNVRWYKASLAGAHERESGMRLLHTSDAIFCDNRRAYRCKAEQSTIIGTGSVAKLSKRSLDSYATVLFPFVITVSVFVTPQNELIGSVEAITDGSQRITVF